MEQVKEVPMLRSEQEFIDWWIANSPLPSEIYAWFKSHQQPFDEETTRGIIDIHFKTLGKALRSTGGVTVQEIKDSLIAALKAIHLGKALHTRGSDPLADEFQEEEYQHEIAGKIYLCTSRAKHGVPCEHCKPVCGTCGGSRKVFPSSCPNTHHSIHWEFCGCKKEPCPDCPPECEACGDSRHVPVGDRDIYKYELCPDCTVERGEQQREGTEHCNVRPYPNFKGRHNEFYYKGCVYPDRRSGEERRAV